MSDKNDLRRQLKLTRSRFSGREREKADAAILNNFIERYVGYESFFIYNSFSSEADTKQLIAKLLRAGKRVYLPRIEGEDMVAVPYGESGIGAFGIEEPTGQAFDGDISVTVIPLLAVNERGFRIGYGKGFYDRYLKDRHTVKVGLGYSFQIADFKEDGWDIPLDAFVCEKGVYAK